MLKKFLEIRKKSWTLFMTFFSCLGTKLKFIFQMKLFCLITYFLSCFAHTSHLFKESTILKLWNKILPRIFKNWFTLPTDYHAYDTRSSSSGCVDVPQITLNFMEETLSIWVPFIHKIIYSNKTITNSFIL